eukprot:TRINITY_DN3682_c0_g2_i1.p1 TRINITY_DN3682_c0_g2~~TRINITY_DN3682_c0_g2_i1.p1  ORF type:complete len:341 (+),score=69.65 TRINITY_DN3682_c0_g2_i1:29-1051(+)
MNLSVVVVGLKKKCVRFCDFYDLSYRDFVGVRGRTWLKHFGDSHIQSLVREYPLFGWRIWSFEMVPRNYWNSREAKKLYVEWLGGVLGYSCMADWYSLRVEDIEKQSGDRLISLYGKSPFKMLSQSYTQFHWNLWQFDRSPVDIWDNEECTTSYLSYLGGALSISQFNDWYRVSYQQIQNFEGNSLLKKNSLFHHFLHLYPSFHWDQNRFLSISKKSSQRWLHLMTCELFPTVSVIEDFHHPTIKFPRSQISIELDIWIPSFNLAFEFQGQHHYQEIPLFGPSSLYQERDRTKLELCKENCISLVVVPFDWNGEKDSLRELIMKAWEGANNYFLKRRIYS